MPSMFTSTNQRNGVLLAFGAFGLWGVFPIYFKLLGAVSPVEILCHRIIWSVPFCGLLIFISRDFRALKKAMASKRVIATLMLTAFLVSCNWGIFIYSIATNRVLQASLGYYINPLFNVLLGTVFLREKLRPMQIVAVLLAAAGTINMTIGVGVFPWISLSLAFSFGMYGYFRKTIKGVESVNGLFVETLLISPLAIGYLIYMGGKGTLVFGHSDGWVLFLLLIAGVITSTPLVMFTAATRRLRLSTVGLIQYLTPTLQFCLAVFVFKEPFRSTHLITFLLIWVGLSIFAADSIATQRGVIRDAHR